MPLLKHYILLAEYNQLMNQRQCKAASKLSVEELNEDKKAFFKSILGTLNHILVGDIIWLKRFAQLPICKEHLLYFTELEKPKSLDILLFQNLDEFKFEREKVDSLIVNWVRNLSDETLDQCLPYQNMVGKIFNKPLSSLINHLFLHQVHHRGQITTLFSQYSIDFGETDLLEIIEECNAEQVHESRS